MVYLPHFFAFLLTLIALALLALCVFSTPFTTALFFLHTSASGGIKFGMWGFCTDDGTSCSPKALGIDWTPELTLWLTKALVLYPIAAGITLLAAVAVLPSFCYSPVYDAYGYRRRDGYIPVPAFVCLSLIAFLSATAALAFSLALWVTAKRRFEADGFEASYGPCIWMSVGAVAALAIVTMSTGCGCIHRGRFQRASPYFAYNL